MPYDNVLFREEITTLQDRFLEDGPPGQPVPETLLDAVLLAGRRALGDIV